MTRLRNLMIVLAFAYPLLAQTAPSPVASVNVFTGTSNSRWMLFPGATVPMGMVKFSPDNQGNVWNGGYEYTIANVGGFSFLHTLGLSSFSMMPVAGSMETEPGHYKAFAGTSDAPFGQMWTAGYHSRINKATEVGSPGYYAVDLVDASTRAELTATARTGWMRFTPPTSEPSHLVLDFGAAAEELPTVSRVEVERVSSTEIVGSLRQQTGYAGQYTVFFVMQFSEPTGPMTSWENGAYTGTAAYYGVDSHIPRTVHPNVTQLQTSKSGGVWIDMPSSGKPLVIRTGISLVSLAEARNNLDVEARPFGFDFDAVHHAAEQTWSKVLGHVEVVGGKPDDRVKLYTNLYRAYTGKAMLDDVSGTYRDACDAVQQLPADARTHMYSSDALWGTQWDLGPLWSLVDPATMQDFDRFLVLQSQRGGWLPSSTPNMHYAAIMDAQHEIALLAGAWQKGERGFNGEAAYQAMRKVLTSPAQPYTCGGSYAGGIVGDHHMEQYMKLGFVPEEDGPASSTFEYAYDDACAATMARSLGHLDDAKMFEKRSGNWRNSLGHEGYAQRRHADGSWIEPNDLFHFGTGGAWTGPGFIEGTAWIYSWFVPQDVPALVKAVGRDRFNQRLEEGFKKKYVDLTNEPNLQAPWLFNYSGRPDLTQRYAREVFSRIFDTSPLTGWPGEEDEGQMGAYVVLAGIGLFDMEGGCAAEPRYQISGPVFREVTLHQPGGDFHIRAIGNSSKAIYIRSASLNGVPLQRLSLSHKEIAKGGTLLLQMSAQPTSPIETSLAKTRQ
jgi:predicted alpha-1,2-mannosidase